MVFCDSSSIIIILKLEYLSLLLMLIKFKNIKRILILNKSSNLDSDDLSAVLDTRDI